MHTQMPLVLDLAILSFRPTSSSPSRVSLKQLSIDPQTLPQTAPYTVVRTDLNIDTNVSHTGRDTRAQ